MSTPNKPTVWLEDIYGGRMPPGRDWRVGTVPASRNTPVAGPKRPPSLAAKVGDAVYSAAYVAGLMLVLAFLLHVSVGVIFFVVALLGH